MKKRDVIVGTFLLASTIWSCSTDEQFAKKQNSASTERIYGDSTRTFNLKVEEASFDYDGWEYGLGVKVPPYDNGTYRISYSPKAFNGTEFDTVVTYNCPIANVSPLDYSGQNDWVVNKEESGYPTGTGGYNYPGLLSITTFKNGLPIAQVIKQTFALSATAYKVGYNPQLQINYNAPFLPQAPFMFLPAQTADNYTNRAVARSGKQVVVIELNPDGLVPETNTNDNIVILPINVTLNSTTQSNLGYAVIDESAILENRVVPASELVVSKNFQGRSKFVKLDWHCVYHEPFYVKHHFTVRKNGVIVADNFDLSEYTETVRGNFTSATYQITITVAGLGTSTPLTVIVTR